MALGKLGFAISHHDKNQNPTNVTKRRLILDLTTIQITVYDISLMTLCNVGFVISQYY
jgi:hypothetical protein